tara:strand:- start:497 stop:751 length:255 start_codon:yes stop_codon:yes gene_type:complete
MVIEEIVEDSSIQNYLKNLCTSFFYSNKSYFENAHIFKWEDARQEIWIDLLHCPDIPIDHVKVIAKTTLLKLLEKGRRMKRSSD